MAWTVINSGPYIEQLGGSKKPIKMVDGTYLFAFPPPEGAVPYIYLDKFAAYIDWIFQNPTESDGMTLDVATAHATGDDVAAAFTAVTGKPAKFQAIPVEMWHAEAWKGLPKGKDTKIGFNSVKDDSHLQLTFEQNFTNWWNLYRSSGGNKGLITRDYERWIGSCWTE
jgi:uncharacterized protein YbjT (DUF2867 family)